MDTTQMRTWAEISLPSLEHNYRALRALTPAGCRFMGLVKANAYGHGAVEVARTLEELGADYLAVACVEEAAQLRRAGIGTPILIRGAVPPGELPLAAELGATVTVFEEAGAEALSAAAMAAGRRVKVHIKADTGMSRLGFPARPEALEDSVRAILRVCALPGLEPEGIFTHFANADGDEGFTREQFARFTALTDALRGKGREFPLRHCAAAAAVIHYPWTHLDMVRPGIALYGHLPDEGCRGKADLRPVMTLKTRAAYVRPVPAGTPVSYGCTRVLDRDSVVATLPIGYGDGRFRALSDRWHVRVRGELAPVLGRICMDMCMVDVTDIPGVAPGDEVEVFGAHVPLEEAAALAGTIPYELLCAVSPRVPRVYLR